MSDELQNADMIDSCLNIESSVRKQNVMNDFSNNFSEPKTKKIKAVLGMLRRSIGR